eukprot:CAMPEP_0119332818 /NCGR_PEP_ID=MMETSP1333-20130426/83673_1 /TAXON_ID=418940 /ORGANISM="Scyphosphaera apsteinii, Strain RCC1455" /LENGTH=166 /DNA_ID=CAMNT_0007342721 /DNA_START=80 /DNA_END=580 /DNA_ORIENTATION=+
MAAGSADARRQSNSIEKRLYSRRRSNAHAGMSAISTGMQPESSVSVNFREFSLSPRNTRQKVELARRSRYAALLPTRASVPRPEQRRRQGCGQGASAGGTHSSGGPGSSMHCLHLYEHASHRALRPVGGRYGATHSAASVAKKVTFGCERSVDHMSKRSRLIGACM